MTATPLAAPAGRTSVHLTTAYPTAARHRIYKHGDRDDIPNPGDMLIVTQIGDGPLALTIETYIRGREVGAFADAALACAAEYDANAEWLAAPATRTVA